MPVDKWISIRITYALIRVAKEKGMDTTSLQETLERSRIKDDDEASEYIPIGIHYQIWKQLMHSLDDPGFPIEVAARRSTEDLQVRGFAAATSSNGWEACERAIRYAFLTSNTTRWRLEKVSEEQARIELDRSGDEEGLGRRCANECAITSWTTQMRSILASDFSPLEVCFRHQRPSSVEAHHQFFGVTPRFEQDFDGFIFESRFLDLVPASANPGMRAFFDQHAQALLDQLPIKDSSLVNQVRQVVTRRLSSGPPSMPVIASELGMSERALRRSLSSESTSYQEILGELRLTLAKKLLANPKAALSDIAFLLGFSEQSAFSRFFRTQSGASPREFRRTIQSPGPD